MDLASRLRAKLDEVALIAERVSAEMWNEDVEGVGKWNEFDEEVRAHLLLHGPAATLRLVAAHRVLVDHAEAHCRKYEERVECGDASQIEHGAAMYEVIYQLAKGYGITKGISIKGFSVEP